MGVNVDPEVTTKFTGEAGKHWNTCWVLNFFLSNLRGFC